MKLETRLVLIGLFLTAAGCGEMELERGSGMQLAQDALSQQGSHKRVLIEFEPGEKGNVIASLQAAGGTIHHTFDSLSTVATTVPEAALAGLTNNPGILFIEEDAKRFPSAQSAPYGIDQVRARDTWDSDRDGVIDASAPTGAGRLVCIIDSGLHIGHEDFAGVNIVGGYPSGWSNDTCGHGTHVAGTIAAANNATGVVGVSPGTVSLYIVKVFGGSSCGWSYASDLIDAAQHCADAGANIISMSLGGSSKSRTEDKAFGKLYGQGILSIAAAGNDGNTRKSYPASYSSVISVAAIDANQVVASFSQQNDAVELSAPGVGILSTVPWQSENTVTVNSITYAGNYIENALHGATTGALVSGGLCDSPGNWAGKVVLCERGTISFFDKVSNVESGGGAAALIFNNEPGPFMGTLGDGSSSAIPAISLSQEDGQYLAANGLGLAADVTSIFSAPGSGYEAWDGTSMATPHVSGLAALVWSSDPSKTNEEIRDALHATAIDLGAAGRDNAYGHGLVQAYDAWQFLGGQASSSDPAPAPEPTPEPTPDPDSTAPAVSNVTSAKTKGARFEIRWDTDEAADTVVTFSCCGDFSNTALVTSHSFGFRGSRGVSYEYSVSSTDAAGNTTTAGPFVHQN